MAKIAASGRLGQVHATNGPNDRGQAIMEIFRVEDGKIAEHWDVVQDVPETAENDNTMF